MSGPRPAVQMRAMFARLRTAHARRALASSAIGTRSSSSWRRCLSARNTDVDGQPSHVRRFFERVARRGRPLAARRAVRSRRRWPAWGFRQKAKNVVVSRSGW